MGTWGIRGWGFNKVNIGHVQGGTHAGWKRQKPARKEWECLHCQTVNKSYLTRCSSCGGAWSIEGDK